MSAILHLSRISCFSKFSHTIGNLTDLVCIEKEKVANVLLKSGNTSTEMGYDHFIVKVKTTLLTSAQ